MADTETKDTPKRTTKRTSTKPRTPRTPAAPAPAIASPHAPSDAELLHGPQPGGGAETMIQVIDKAKEAAAARKADAEAAADTASELAKLAAMPMAPLNRATSDVLGRELPADLTAARAQEREAIAIRQSRVDVDVARTQRGLPPKYATK